MVVVKAEDPNAEALRLSTLDYALKKQFAELKLEADELQHRSVQLTAGALTSDKVDN